jgi:putative heme-binding domain-containing protein
MSKGFLLLAVALTCFAAEQEKVTLPTSAADLARGEKLYKGSCLFCHGPAGEGGKGANLARARLTRAANDEELVRIIEQGIPGTEMPGAWHMTRKEATQVAAYMRTFARVEARAVTGDAARGQTLYQGKGGCTACHSLREKSGGEMVRVAGGLSGPDLTGIGARRSVAYLREALLNPGATVPDAYVSVRVTTNTGRTIIGRLLFEDTFDIGIQDEAGKNHSFSKASLKERVTDRNRSVMPAYGDRLSGAELDDLLAYLVSLEEVR